MASVSLQEAQAKLTEIIHGLSPGEEVVITENDLPVARIVPTANVHQPRQLGALQGSVLHMAPDFDAPLADFQEYQS